jgi:lambda repressor-like predicted transcriptional regulator
LAGKDDVVWDDAAFRARVEAACKRRGIPLREALVNAGASRYYFNKVVQGRQTDVIMLIARELGVPPAELAFGVRSEGAEEPPPADERQVEQGLDVAGHFDAESLRRLIATMFTAQQVMALLYLALNQKEANLEAVAELILKAAHGGPRASSSGQESSDEGADGAAAANHSSTAERLGMGAK